MQCRHHCRKCSGTGVLPVVDFKDGKITRNVKLTHIECDNCSGRGWNPGLMSREDHVYVGLAVLAAAYFIWQLFIRPFF